MHVYCEREGIIRRKISIPMSERRIEIGGKLVLINIVFEGDKMVYRAGLGQSQRRHLVPLMAS
jgi:hypothetical protein